MSEIDNLKAKIKSLEQDLQNPEIFNSPEKLASLSKEYNRYKERLQNLESLDEINKKIIKTEEILRTESDPELLKLAEEEIVLLKKQKKEFEKKIKISSDDWMENKDVIVEIRAGTGGEEAALFAADLYRMYSRYAENKNWRIEILNSSRTDLGGFKEIVFKISGPGAYKQLQYESGVHRVQRIPETEKSGRVHTSTATVAVLPEISEIDIKIKPEDLKIETFRASGHGGQNVQKTETAVRITHLPTNLVVSCQDERSQQRNKDKAMKILRAHLFLQQKESQIKEQSEKRRRQIGSAKRAEKIRTYNFPQNRITDHRINKSWYNLLEALEGKIDNIIASLQEYGSETNA